MARGFKFISSSENSSEVAYTYLVQGGISLVPFTGGATQQSNYIAISRGYNADYLVYQTTFDVTDYRMISLKFTNANPATTPGLYCGNSGWNYADGTVDTIYFDISAQTGVQTINTGPRINNSSYRLVELVLFK